MSDPSIICTHCGASEVQQVKPGTYFCARCERVFKATDAVDGGTVPAARFCEHGNEIRFRCQGCAKGMCVKCDAVAAWRCARNHGYVQTRGFGYSAQWRWPGTAGAVGFHGVFISLGKLLAGLSLSLGVRVEHACHRCVTGAVPEVAERISRGEICEMLLCDAEPAVRCPCCTGAFCSACSSPEVLRQDGAAAVLIGRYCVAAKLPGFRADPSFWGSPVQRAAWSAPDGLCASCVWERNAAAEKAALQIVARDYAGEVRALSEGEYAVGGVAPRRRKRLQNEQAEAEALAARYAADVSGQLAALVMAGDGCARRPAAHGGHPPGSYRLVDDRDRELAAAASPVLWIGKPPFDD